MKRIIFGIFIIITAFVFSVSAQDSVQKTFENGIKSAGKGEFQTALADFQKSLALAGAENVSDNFLAKIHFNIGVCFYRMKQQAKAVEAFERAVLLNPGYEKSFYALGMAQFELKNFREAEEAFLDAIRLNDRNGETWFDLAFVYLARENFESAKAAFEKSIKLKSVDSSISHNNLGVILAINGDFDSAVREFEIALKKSKGKLAVAERNLRFCKSLGKNFSRDLPANLRFGQSRGI